MTETVRIDTTVSAPVALASAAVFYGTLSQIGYFGEVGIEFLSMTGAGDWLYAIGLVGVPALIIWWPIVLAVRWISFTEFDNEGANFSLWKIILSWKFNSAILAFIILGTILAVAGSNKGWPVLRFAQFLMLAAYVFSTLYWLAVALRDGFSAVGATPMMLFAASSGFCCWLAGGYYAQFLAGRECLLIASDNRFDHGVYYRSVGEGHLFKTGGRMHFIPKGNVKEMICR